MNAFIAQLMAKVAARSGNGGSGGRRITPSSLTAIAAAVNQLTQKIQAFNSQNRITGIPNSSSFESEILAQGRLLNMMNQQSLQTAANFINDKYKYITFPGIDVAKQAGGEYGSIMSAYLNTRETFKKERADLGGSIGTAVGVGAVAAGRLIWFRRAFTGLSILKKLMTAAKIASLGAAATGIGTAPGVVTLAISALVETATTVGLMLLGRKLGESTATKEDENGQSAADINAGVAGASELFALVPKLRDMYTQNSLTLHQTGMMKGKLTDMVSTYQSVASTSHGGVTLRNLGLGDVNKVATLMSNVARSTDVATSARGTYASYVGKFQVATGEDITGTLGTISNSLAKTESNSQKSIDFTAALFDNFFNIATKGGQVTTKAATGIAQSMAELAKSYSDKYIVNSDAAKTVMQTQRFTQNYLQKPGETGTKSAEDFLGVTSKIAAGSMDSSMSNNLLNAAGISRSDAAYGLNGNQIDGLLSVSDKNFQIGKHFAFDKDKQIVTKGDKKAADQVFATFYNKATGDKASGGMGLNADEAMIYFRSLIAYSNNPGAFKAGEVNSIDPLASTVNGHLGTNKIQYNAFTQVAKALSDLGNNYLMISSTFIPSFSRVSQMNINKMYSMRFEIAQGLVDATALLKEKGFMGSGVPTGGPTTGGSFGAPVGTTGSWGRGSLNKTVLNTSGVQQGLKGHLYNKEFITKVEAMSLRLGVDPNWLMALMAHESAGTFQTGYIKGSTAVGLIQFTEIAVTEMNRVYKVNLTKDQLSRMSQEEQLVWVEKYLAMQARGRKISNAGELYTLIFTPDAFGKADGAGIYRLGSREYGKNASLDANQDGIITAGEIRAVPFREGGYGRSYMEGVSYDLQEDSLDNSELYESLEGHGVTGKGAFVMDSNYSSRTAISHGYLASSRVYRNGEAAKLGVMSGVSTKIGLQTAQIMQTALKTRGANMGYSGTNFYLMCAGVASRAVAQAGGTRTSGLTADAQLAEWFRLNPNAVLSEEQISKTGFQPGDMIWVVGGNHVGIVDVDGSIIQAGGLRDMTDGDYLVRTDITTFEYTKAWVAIRPGMDANGDGKITAAERQANLMLQGLKPTKPDSKKPSIGKKYLVNVQNNRYTVKTAKGGSLSKDQVNALRKIEHSLEKKLGLKDSDLEIGVNTNTGGRFVSIKINSGNLDPSKVAATILKEIESVR